MDWHFDNDKFISLIESRAALWDTSNEDYCNKIKKQQCWVEVATEILEGFEELTPIKQNEYGKELQKKWKNLKFCFSRELAKRKTKSSGSATSWKTYIFFDQLSFLSKCAPDKETTASLPSPQEVDKTVTDDSVSVDDTVTVKEPKRKYKKYDKGKDPSCEVLDVIKSNLHQREVNERRLNEDDDRNFLLSLLGDFKRVREDRKLELKVEIMQAIKRALTSNQPIAIQQNPSSYNYFASNNYRTAETPMSTTFSPYQQSGYVRVNENRNIYSQSTMSETQSPAQSVESLGISEDSQFVDLLTDYNKL